jgi:hypothetical protein
MCVFNASIRDHGDGFVSKWPDPNGSGMLGIVELIVKSFESQTRS